MGKEFTAVMQDGTERFAATMSNDRSRLFYQIAVLLESYVQLPCGISPDEGDDEHRIDPDAFIVFFEKVHATGWITAPEGFTFGWASHAAGMIENITLKPRTWICRDGSSLKVSRYLRAEEIQSKKQTADPVGTDNDGAAPRRV